MPYAPVAVHDRRGGLNDLIRVLPEGKRDEEERKQNRESKNSELHKNLTAITWKCQRKMGF